jgi:hypothetical protein
MEKQSKRQIKTPAANERFGAMAGVRPLKRQCDFGGFVPA